MRRHLLFLFAILIVFVTVVAGCKSPYDFDQPGTTPVVNLTTVESTKTSELPVLMPTFLPGNYQATSAELTEITPEAKLALAEVCKIIGLPIPVPTYFLEGYRVTSLELKEGSMPQAWSVTITIDNGNSSGPITLVIQWFSLGMKIPPGAERIKIGNSTCMVSRQSDGIHLSWMGKTGHGLSLTGNSNISFEELVKMAESVTAPPKRIIEATLNPDSDLIVLRGDSQQLVIHLQNNSSKSLVITTSKDNENLPKGIEIEMYGDSLLLQWGQSVDIPVRVKVAEDAESPIWEYKPASYFQSTDTPPPLSGGFMEEPYCRLAFLVTYEYPTYKDTLVHDRTSLGTRLRIDMPKSLPAGTVTLKEAESKADFPLGLLLPSYFPQGTNPVPVGYQVSTEVPHSITAFYSDYRVVLSPEPGVLEPPESYTGEKTIIRKKTVIIGQNRVDWWVYDLHFSVISDEIPMSEMKLIVESMMLIGTVSGSWLGEGP